MYLYIIKESGKAGAIKIGIASNVDARIDTLQTGNPRTLELVISYKCRTRKHAFALEAWMHKTFGSHRIRGEWFSGKIQLSRAFGKLSKDPTGF